MSQGGILNLQLVGTKEITEQCDNIGRRKYGSQVFGPLPNEWAVNKAECSKSTARSRTVRQALKGCWGSDDCLFQDRDHSVNGYVEPHLQRQGATECQLLGCKNVRGGCIHALLVSFSEAPVESKVLSKLASWLMEWRSSLTSPANWVEALWKMTVINL